MGYFGYPFLSLHQHVIVVILLSFSIFVCYIIYCTCRWGKHDRGLMSKTFFSCKFSFIMFCFDVYMKANFGVHV